MSSKLSGVYPACAAISSRYGSLSMAMTVSAPSSRALSMANCPTGPAPHTATTSPGSMPHISAPMYPVGRMSDKNSTCSSARSFSIFNGPTSANGTRAYSDCPPAKPPVRCE